MKTENQSSWVTPFLVLTLFTAVFSAYSFIKIQALEKSVGTGAIAGQPSGDANAPAAAEPTPNLAAMPEVTDKDWIRGNKNASVVLVEYSDYECPFCKNFHSTMQQVAKEYGNKVAWVYRHYPLPFHTNAQMESEAAECVGEVGGKDKFWQYSDMIYSKTQSTGTSFTKEQMVDMAAEVGVNKAKVQSCLDSGKYTQKVKDQMSAGAEAGIQGTPGTVIVGKNGQKELIPGALPYDQVKPMIDKML
jgi:protein-disulfide isomerase